jgi:hypothetical protein
MDDPRDSSVEGMFFAWDAMSGLIRSQGAVAEEYFPRVMVTMTDLTNDAFPALYASTEP